LNYHSVAVRDCARMTATLERNVEVRSFQLGHVSIQTLPVRDVLVYEPYVSTGPTSSECPKHPDAAYPENRCHGKRNVPTARVKEVRHWSP
jgi:hypothetical protein